MTDDDAKVNRADLLGAGALTAISAILAAAGCSGKNKNDSGDQSSDPSPNPQGTLITHPVHIYAQFPLGGTTMGAPSANATTCTIVICDATTPPPTLPNGATKILAVNSPSATSNGDSCDPSGATQQQQSVLIYVS